MKILFLGGARSGKSALALEAAAAQAGPGSRFYVATAEAGDDEMRRRIAAHRLERGDDWDTIEEPLDLAGVLGESRPGQVHLVDCLTLWLSNVMEAWPGEEEEVVGELASTLATASGHVVLVANEVGLGIVPENDLARRFRDLAGKLNQQMARLCHEVYFVAAGLKLRMK